MNTLRYNTTIPYISKNIIADFFLSIQKRPGYAHSHTPILPTMMIRRIGVSSTLDEENTWLKQLIDRIEAQNIPYVFIGEKMKFEPSVAFVSLVKSQYETLTPSYDNIIEITKKVFRQIRGNSHISCDSIEDSIIHALHLTFSRFIESDGVMSKSKFINFAVKILYWMDQYYKTLIIQLDKIDQTSAYINCKFIYRGPITKHESYVFLFNHYLGIDSLYLHPEEDFLTQINPYLSTLSQLQLLEKRAILPVATVVEPARVKAKSIPESPKTVSSPLAPPIVFKQRPIHEVIHVKFKPYDSIDNQLEVLLDPLSQRIGYLGLPSPILPTYFVRYIGVDQSFTAYSNRLFNFNKSCTLSQKKYKHYDQQIPLLVHQPLIDKISDLFKSYVDVKPSDLKALVEQLNTLDCLNFIKEDLLRDQSYLALCRVLNLAFKESTSIPTQKVKNLVGKLLSWLKSAYLDFIKPYNYNQINNPLVLYYGALKAHEALFLVFLFELGIDIVYINPFEDNLFGELDPTNTFSSLVVLDTVIPVFDFPENLQLERHETVAFKASEEMNHLLYNDQNGIYKPWQFENYKTQPVTLKATYDEVKILWHEDARIRSGFKVLNGCMFIPNIFVKISGTTEDLQAYWRDVRLLTNGQLTLFFKSLPFTTIQYNRQELFSLDFLLINHEKLDREKLKSSQFYPYGYLSLALQTQIMDKIDDLMTHPILNTFNQADYKVKVLMTLLKLSKPIIEAIQQFDYPGKIPKLVIYTPNETVMSEEDAITMAFLYLIGFDLALITPTGYNNIESFFSPQYFDIFPLPKKQFNLALPDLKHIPKENSKSFWENLFG